MRRVQEYAEAFALDRGNPCFFRSPVSFRSLSFVVSSAQKRDRPSFRCSFTIGSVIYVSPGRTVLILHLLSYDSFFPFVVLGLLRSSRVPADVRPSERFFSDESGPDAHDTRVSPREYRRRSLRQLPLATVMDTLRACFSITRVALERKSGLDERWRFFGPFSSP